MRDVGNHEKPSISPPETTSDSNFVHQLGNLFIFFRPDVWRYEFLLENPGIYDNSTHVEKILSSKKYFFWDFQKCFGKFGRLWKLWKIFGSLEVMVSRDPKSDA